MYCTGTAVEKVYLCCISQLRCETIAFQGMYTDMEVEHYAFVVVGILWLGWFQRVLPSSSYLLNLLKPSQATLTKSSLL